MASEPVTLDALVAEIGSTTVVSAFAGLIGWPNSEPRLLGQGVAATSVAQGDVYIGLDAALGAGGVEHQTAGELRGHDLGAIEAARPGLILLAGGVEGGDTATVLHNAEQLTCLSARPIVVYAGNSAAMEEVRSLLESAGFSVRVTANVYPDVDELDIVPARAAIHDAFEEHITRAPGMENVAARVIGRILPTPGAVLTAAEESAADRVTLDAHYVFACCGALLGHFDSAAVVTLMLRSIDGDVGEGC